METDMREVRFDLLRRLVDLLERLEDSRFCFSSYVYCPERDSDSGTYETLLESGEKGSCGTMACALGWATTIPEIREAGLYLFGGVVEYRDPVGPICKFDHYAAAAAFGISHEDARRLFFGIAAWEAEDPDLPLHPRLVSGERILCTASRAEVTARIRQFCDREGRDGWWSAEQA